MEVLDSPMFFAYGEKLSVLAELLTHVGTKAHLSQNGSSKSRHRIPPSKIKDFCHPPLGKGGFSPLALVRKFKSSFYLNTLLFGAYSSHLLQTPSVFSPAAQSHLPRRGRLTGGRGRPPLPSPLAPVVSPFRPRKKQGGLLQLLQFCYFSSFFRQRLL